jgi:hypothetical protein
LLKNYQDTNRAGKTLEPPRQLSVRSNHFATPITNIGIAVGLLKPAQLALNDNDMLKNVTEGQIVTKTFPQLLFKGNKFHNLGCGQIRFQTTRQQALVLKAPSQQPPFLPNSKFTNVMSDSCLHGHEDRLYAASWLFQTVW